MSNPHQSAQIFPGVDEALAKARQSDFQTIEEDEARASLAKIRSADGMADDLRKRQKMSVLGQEAISKHRVLSIY